MSVLTLTTLEWSVVLFENVEGAAVGAGACDTCSTSAAKQKMMAGHESSIKQREMWVWAKREVMSPLVRGVFWKYDVSGRMCEAMGLRLCS